MNVTRLYRKSIGFILLFVISIAATIFYTHLRLTYAYNIKLKKYLQANRKIKESTPTVGKAISKKEIKIVHQCSRKDVGIVNPKIIIQDATWKIKNKDLDVARIYSVANYSYLNPTCHSSNLISTFNCSKERIKVLIVVTSRVMGFIRRRTIRMTWGKTLQTQVNNDFKTFFLVGKSTDEKIMKKIKKESEIYKDIIFGNYDDVFYNLPFKVETGFEWAYKYCSFDYYLKADDDVFINLPELFELLSRKDTPKRELYLGNVQEHPLAQRAGKYVVTREEYRTTFLPPFCSGGGFIFSSDAVKSVIPYFQKNPFKLDDVYIAMLVMNAGIKPKHHDKFKFFETTCVFHINYITHHGWGTTSKRSCMERIFYGMLANKTDSFIKTHYGLQL